jgi:1-acyl-sn-glycerol-3-phosphate acyltransferase
VRDAFDSQADDRPQAAAEGGEAPVREAVEGQRVVSRARGTLPPEVVRGLAPLERWHVRAAQAMNREPLKRFWTLLQRTIGARLVRWLVHGHTDMYGLEHVVAADRSRPILLVANHRTYFDMFVVTSLLFRHTRVIRRIFFPVVGQYYYQSLGGMALNAVFGSWAMFPPLFALPTHREFDRHALELLVDLCREGEGHIIGIHPEGGRNRNPDPYSLMRIQPGTGRIIHMARPQVIPVFLAGISNDPRDHVRAHWRRDRRVRVHFGPALDLSAFYELPPKGSTYKSLTDYVMSQVIALGEQDRARYAT